MKKNILIASGLLISLLSGCATVQDGAKTVSTGFESTSKKVGNAIGLDGKTSSAVGGAGIGCVVGGAVGAMVAGSQGALKGCAIGGVAGGALSLFQAYENELQESQRVKAELEAQNNGLRVQVAQKPVVVTDEVKQADGSVKKESKKVQSVDKLTVDLTKDVVADSDSTGAIAQKLGGLIDKSPKKQVSVVVYADKNNGERIKQQLINSVSNKEKLGDVKVVNAKSPKIVLTPIPV